MSVIGTLSISPVIVLLSILNESSTKMRAKDEPCFCPTSIVPVLGYDCIRHKCRIRLGCVSYFPIVVAPSIPNESVADMRVRDAGLSPTTVVCSPHQEA